MPEGDQRTSRPVLPLGVVVVGAFDFLWAKRLRLARATALPLLALVVLGIYWYNHAIYLGPLTQIPGYVLYCVVFTVLAVTCHRLVLLGDDAVPPLGLSGWTMRETRFLAWLLGLTLVSFPIYMLLVMTIGTVVVNILEFPANWFQWLLEALAIPATYVLARLSLVFPATALDRTPNVSLAWRLSEGNGWRLVIVVGVLPWLLALLQGFLWRQEATIVEVALLYLVFYIGAVVEIAALSYSYKELTRRVILL